MYLRYTCECSASLNTQEVDFPVQRMWVFWLLPSVLSTLFSELVTLVFDQQWHYQTFIVFPYQMASLLLLAKWPLLFVVDSVFLVSSEFLALSQSLLCCLPEWSRTMDGQAEERQGVWRAHGQMWLVCSLFEDGAPSSVTFLSNPLYCFFFFLPWCYFSSLYTSNFKTMGKDAFLIVSFFFFFFCVAV